jgi:hypothetical protein
MSQIKARRGRNTYLIVTATKLRRIDTEHGVRNIANSNRICFFLYHLEDANNTTAASLSLARVAKFCGSATDEQAEFIG